MKNIIQNVGPFPLSKAILHDEKYILEISGQIGVEEQTGKLTEGIENQTTQVLENIKKILVGVGWDLTNVIKTTVYLSDMNDYVKMNEIYGKYFQENYPTRTAMAVKELPRGALIEIQCTASGNDVKK